LGCFCVDEGGLAAPIWPGARVLAVISTVPDIGGGSWPGLRAPLAVLTTGLCWPLSNSVRLVRNCVGDVRRFWSPEACPAGLKSPAACPTRGHRGRRTVGSGRLGLRPARPMYSYDSAKSCQFVVRATLRPPGGPPSLFCDVVQGSGQWVMAACPILRVVGTTVELLRACADAIESGDPKQER